MPAKRVIMTSSKTQEKIFQLKVTLNQSKPPIWRRVLVDDRTTLPELHMIIQAMMGWTNGHLHQFIHQRQYYGNPDMLEDVDVLDYSKIRIREIMRVPKDTLKYEYDFGDGWLHQIVLEKVHDKVKDVKYPFCVDGARACPPEDSGGIYGYMNLLSIIADPKHPEHEEMLEWLGEEFDPEKFSTTYVNTMLHSPNHGVFNFYD